MKYLLALSLMVVGASVSLAAVELAKVNGRPITSKDLKQSLGAMSEGQRKSLLEDKNSRRQVLLNVIDQEILAQQAEKEKLDQDQDYKEALALFKKQYLANRILSKNLTSKLSEAAAKKYYEANKTTFSTDEVHAQHILVKEEAEAKKLLAEVKKPDADFQAVAEKNSIDPSAKHNRGDLGFFTRDKMVKEFAEPVFLAEKGAIIGPLRTAFGYHIVKIIERKTGRLPGYDEVEIKVKNALQAEVIQSYVESLKKNSKIQINEANVTSFKD